MILQHCLVKFKINSQIRKMQMLQASVFTEQLPRFFLILFIDEKVMDGIGFRFGRCLPSSPVGGLHLRAAAADGHGFRVPGFYIQTGARENSTGAFDFLFVSGFQNSHASSHAKHRSLPQLISLLSLISLRSTDRYRFPLHLHRDRNRSRSARALRRPGRPPGCPGCPDLRSAAVPRHWVLSR